MNPRFLAHLACIWEASARKNRSKILSFTSGAIPIPVSRTSSTTDPFSRRPSRSIRPPGRLYSIALWSRLTSTSRSLSGSVSSSSGAATRAVNSTPLAAASGRMTAALMQLL